MAVDFVERVTRLERVESPGAPPRGRVSFNFDGRELDAIDGEPIAVALLAAGVRVFRTTPAGHPRGGFCFVGRCADCLMVVDGVPNTRACQTAIRAGMRVETQQGLGPAEAER